MAHSTYAMVSQERLKELLHYDPERGTFHWRTKQGHMLAGMPAGGHKAEYLRIKIDFTSYYAHRLAFLYMTGSCPLLVDHINGDTGDNRWCNLRSTTLAGNQHNRRLNGNSTSGYKGVHVADPNSPKPYRARIQVNNKRVSLGRYRTAEEASAAYCAAAVKYFGEFARFE